MSNTTKLPEKRQAGRAESPGASGSPESLVVNDMHSGLNATRVAEIARPTGLAEIQELTRRAHREGRSIAIAGGRHAMGGQQFVAGDILLDTTKLNRILNLDDERGILEAEAGVQWPELLDYLWLHSPPGKEFPGWTIRQKQTGADRLSLGGALAANAHGRGLDIEPFVNDVESFVLVNARGEALTCSRSENRELFSLVAGGYGLFGIVYSLRLRLTRRKKLRRLVELRKLRSLNEAFRDRIEEGCIYGDFQFCTDETSPDFMRLGVFSCYDPVPEQARMPAALKTLGPEDWHTLYHLSHVDKAAAFRMYSSFYLSTSRQLYWSDLSQLSYYQDDYHREVDHRCGAEHPGSEVITELYVPRERLVDFMEAARRDFLEHGVNLIYGTIRLIRRDRDSFLKWARGDFACVIFNLHVEHEPGDLAKNAAAFRRLIDLAREREGSFFLTYHRHGTREQVEDCYPEFREFLRLKELHDPEGIFQSDWYRHYRGLFDEGHKDEDARDHAPTYAEELKYEA